MIVDVVQSKCNVTDGCMMTLNAQITVWTAVL